jgi:hypothetical protein
MENSKLWGPLAALAGEWEGELGLDIAFNNVAGVLRETKFRERATFDAFGPVDNGKQQLYGLDYRMAAWRDGEPNPFHTEIGYWLWDAATQQVMRCFMVPRGTTVLAGGTATADATRFALEANLGQETYGILSNKYLAERARTTKYTCQVMFEGDTFSYDSCTTYIHAIGGEVAHTDRNTLRKVRK